MLIGIDASRLLTARRTGTETYSYQLLRHIAARYARGDTAGDILRLYFNESAGERIADAVAALDPTGAAPIETRAIPFPRLWTHARLSAEIAAHPPERLFVPAHVIPLWHPRHSIVTLHDIAYHYYPETYTPRMRRYLDLSTRWSIATARRVITPSEATRRDLIRVYAAPPAKVVAIAHGYDRALFAPVSDPAVLAVARSAYGIAAGRYLLFVGTIQPRKNLSRLLDAFHNLITDPAFGDVRLVIAGKQGWLAAPIIAQAQRLGLAHDPPQPEDRVRLPGYVAETDLPALICGAAAFVYPALHEGFGLPVLEAMACGAVVVASNTPALAEVAGDGALLPDPLSTAALHAALRTALADEPRRADLHARALARAARFDWDVCAAQSLDIIRGA